VRTHYASPQGIEGRDETWTSSTLDFLLSFSSRVLISSTRFFYVFFFFFSGNHPEQLKHSAPLPRDKKVSGMSISVSSLLRFGTVGVSGVICIFSIVGLATPMLTFSNVFAEISIGLWSVKSKSIFASAFGGKETEITLSASELKGAPCGFGERMQAGQAFGILLLLGSLAMSVFFTMRILPQFVPSAPKLEAVDPKAKFAGIAAASWGALCSVIVFGLFSALRDCQGSMYSYGAGWVMYLLCFLMCGGLIAAEVVLLFVVKEAPELPSAQPMLSFPGAPQPGIATGAVYQPPAVFQQPMQQQAQPMQQQAQPKQAFQLVPIKDEANDL
jgi:hypothetical protein